VWVPYGRPAADALRTAIADSKGGDPLRAVTVVVASNHVGVASRRLLASGVLGPVCPEGAGIAAVTFVTPYRLAEWIAAPALAGTGRRPVSTPVIAAAVRAVLGGAPGRLSPVATHPATETALVSAYRELRDLSPRALDALAGTGAIAAEVVRIHASTRARLADAWYDEQDLLQAATAVVQDPAHALEGVGDLILYLPARLSRPVTDLCAAAGRCRHLTIVAGCSGHAGADAEVLEAVAAITGGAAGVEPAPSGPVALPVDRRRTTILTASDADDEVRAALRSVVQAALDGTPLDRIAILHPATGPYRRLVHEQLEAAGIPANGTAVEPVAARMVGRALLELLRLPAADYRREDVFAWLSTAPVRDGLDGVDRGTVPVAAWERLSRDASIVTGGLQWEQRLATLEHDLAERAGAADADARFDGAGAVPTRGLRHDSARVGDLRRFMAAVVAELDQAARTPRTWSEHAAWTASLLGRLLGAGDDRAAWPVPERAAAEALDTALRRLAALDTVEGPVDLDTFTRTLEIELQDDLGRTGRFGEGVLVGSIGLGVGLDLDLVVVLGLSEGSYPGGVHQDALLPDEARAKTGGELDRPEHAVDRAHRQLLAALAGARRQVLCVPRGDLRRSRARVPSRWVLDIAAELAGRPLSGTELLSTTAPWLDNVASFAASLRRDTFPVTDQEHRLRHLLAGTLVGATDVALNRAVEALTARRSSAFTRFDGNLAGARVASPLSRVNSPTSLERWATCPFSYLAHDLLGVDPVDNPEDHLSITALDRGSLMHQALEEFFTEVIDRPPPRQPGPDQPWSGEDRALLAAIARRLCDDYERRGLTGRPMLWRIDRDAILQDLDDALTMDERHRLEHRARPLSTELAFGFGLGDAGAVELALADGRRVRFRGRADRVDVCEDGTLYVIDYKTGSCNDHRSLSEERPDGGGKYLQLPVYGLAARRHHADGGRPVRSAYWFVTARGNHRVIGYPVSAAVLEQVGASIATIVDGIEAGVFPHRPPEVSTSAHVRCRYCDPDGLGTAELRRQWQRKRDAPAVRRYAALAEPDEPDAPDAPSATPADPPAPTDPVAPATTPADPAASADAEPAGPGAR